ncbi:MAG: hypothetical protein ACKOQ6_02660, partial [Bacteroidota bacterium]
GYNLYYDAFSARDNFSGNGTEDSSIFDVSKNGDNPLTSWTVRQGTLSYKHEIVDVGTHFRRQYVDTTIILNPFTPLADTIDTIAGRDIWGYGFMTTFNTDGDNYIDFEFLRSKPSFDVQSGAVSNSGPSLTGGHTRFYFDSTAKPTEIGDAIFAINYAQFATSPVVSVRVWVNPSDLGPGITGFTSFNTKSKRPFDFTGVFTSGTNSNGFGYAEIRPRGSNNTCLFYSRANNVSAAGCNVSGTAWGNIGYPVNNYSDSIPCFRFVEFGMNMTKFGLEGIISGIECGTPNAFMIAKTRSGSAFIDAARDYAGPYSLGNINNADAGQDKTINCASPTATLTGSSFTPYGVIQWSVVPGSGGHIVSGANTLSPVVDSAGIYVMSVSNAPPLQCIVTDTVSVLADYSTPTVSASSSNDISCSTTSSTLTATATASSGNTIATYSWSNGGTSATTTVTAAGTYTVTVTQSNGCTSSASVTVSSDNSTPTVSASSSNDISCSTTSSTLTATATASSGNTIATYSWSNGGTSATTTVTAAGTYTVTVTQSKGCTSSASVTVSSDYSTPTVSASSSNDISCSTTSSTLTATATASSGNTIA